MPDLEMSQCDKHIQMAEALLLNRDAITLTVAEQDLILKRAQAHSTLALVLKGWK